MYEMTECEDKATPLGKHDSLTNAQRSPEHQHKSDFTQHGHGLGSETSSVYCESEQSKNIKIEFKDGHLSDLIVDQTSSEFPSDQFDQQHQTHLDSIFKLLEHDIVTFVKKELKNIQNILNPGYLERSESQRMDEEQLDGEDEEQRKTIREAFQKITQHYLRRRKQEELANRLQSSKTVAFLMLVIRHI